ncbi:hypothetical protein N658DRAFT_434585 [Parathielavia hyrcaniae]|uniref:2'-phosphotransferase n=1 Tax=Parathielavia hyrcaniae TaxID=113614 RepID=A0AAN6SXM9_9PEZI|nr:hypothetical protein N658DRAFT_434585 [Parathielavia hyrcaniae]
MAAAVAVPLSTIHGELGGILPPSAVVQHSPRHGRSRAMSFKGKGNRQRGYSLAEERDVTLAKAVMFVVKRAIQRDEVEDGDDREYLVADSEGWVSVADLLAHSRISALDATLEDIQRIIATATKARFDLRPTPKTDTESRSNNNPASWQLSRIVTDKEEAAAASLVPVTVGDNLTADSPDLPEFVIYETSYQRYPLLLAQGAITRAPGGSSYHTFVPLSATAAGDEDGAAGGEPRSQNRAEAAEVRVWIHLRTALQAEPGITWRRGGGDGGGAVIVTADEVPRSLWKKAVARRPDIGVLLEDGEVRKEVPANLRKGAKGRSARKGKGAAMKREGSGEESGTGSASEE